MKLTTNSICSCGCGLKYKACKAAKVLKAEIAAAEAAAEAAKRPRVRSTSRCRAELIAASIIGIFGG